MIIEGKKAPTTLKRDGSISKIIGKYSPSDLLAKLTFLEPGDDILSLFLRYMEQYNLLPNDALILATCKLNGIQKIASYDADFEAACAGEGIQLIRSVSDIALYTISN